MRALLALIMSLSMFSTASAADTQPVRVKLQTSKGDIIVKLFKDKAPISVANFLGYVEKAHYNGTIFHRVIPGFMIQGGGYDALMVEREAGETIQNEADNGLSNKRGTLAMARQPQPHTARVQWFINHVDNDFLDHRNKDSGRGWGYAVFGVVESGMEVVDAIAEVETTVRSGMRDVPVEPVIIEKITVIETAGD